MDISKIKERIGVTDESYDFLQTNEHLNDNIVLLGFGGSRAYGTNLPTSDIDVRGIAIRTAEDICLMRDFEQVVDVTTDTTIYSLDKMFSLLSECNPNTIEMLGLRPQDYIYVSDIGQQILDNKRIFLSKRCINTFGGYATQQLYRLRQKSLCALSPEEYSHHIAKVIAGMDEHLTERWGITSDQLKVYADGEDLKVTITNIEGVSADTFHGICSEINNVIKDYTKNSTRNSKAMAHAKVHKHAMHLLRLYMMAVDLMEKQEIITYRPDEHDILMKIRNGECTAEDGNMSDEFWTLLGSWEDRFQRAKETTLLPDQPDYEAINRLRYAINEQIVKNSLMH